MLLSANTPMARDFISKFLSLTLAGELEFQKVHRVDSGGAVIRVSPASDGPGYIELSEGYCTHINGYFLYIYSYDAGAKFIVHISSVQYGRKRLVGETDADSFNQDLSKIFRKAKGEIPEAKVESMVFESDLKLALDNFVINN